MAEICKIIMLQGQNILSQQITYREMQKNMSTEESLDFTAAQHSLQDSLHNNTILYLISDVFT